VLSDCTLAVSVVTVVWVQFHLTDWIPNSFCPSPLPPFEKGGKGKTPFVKGDLAAFSSAQHHFDEILSFGILALTGKRLSR
jgi:hypothetical protein